MSFGRYVAGWTWLALVVIPIALGSRRLRRRILPAWSSAPAVVAETVIGLGALIGVSQVLGAVGAFEQLAVVAVTAAAGLVALELVPARRDIGADETDEVPDAGVGTHPLICAASFVAGAAVFGQWVSHAAASVSTGIVQVDSVWYHLPRAARFAQDGWLTRLHVTGGEFPDTFHPANSELLHALGMVLFERDILSPVLGFVWLALALVAGWCIGRPFGVAPISMMGIAALLATPRLATDSAGTASNDIMAVALLLTAVALLLQPDRGRAATAIAAVAAGLALGTKLTVVAPIALLTVGLVLTEGKGARARVASHWLLPLMGTGGYWYVRNVVHTGSPLPGLDLPFLPAARFEIVDDLGYSVADYLTDGDVWRAWLSPGLEISFGWTWPLLIGLAVVAAVVALAVGPRSKRALGAVVVGGSALYLVTPTTALGPLGAPTLFASNLIYMAPALAVGLALAPTVLSSKASRNALAAVFVLLIVVESGVTGIIPAWHPDEILPGAIAGSVALGAVVLAIWCERYRRARSVGLIAISLALVLLGLPVGRRHLEDRYSDDPVAQWALELSGQRIAIAGDTQQYSLYDVALTNHVQYMFEAGDHGAAHELDDCTAWRAALRDGGYQWVSLRGGRSSASNRQLAWTLQDPAATSELVHDTGQIFKFDASVPDPGCP